jgi:hypothetical protein
VKQAIAELAALVDRTGRLGSDVARHAIGPGELPKQALQAVSAAFDIGISLGVGALEIALREGPGPP